MLKLRKLNYILTTLIIITAACSILLIYFSEKIPSENVNFSETKRIKSCDNLKELFNKINPQKIKWMLNRIDDYCEDWQKIKLGRIPNRENIMIIIGLLIREEQFHFARDAFHGGPLGELVQWTDTITSLYTLGHNLTIVIDQNDRQFKNRIQNIDSFKLIFVDYIALKILKDLFPDILNNEKIRCKFRVLDSFGTEAQFNLGIVKCSYCGYKLNLKQYYTMFPHTPDNSFLGFVIRDEQKMVYKNKQNIAVIYAKDQNFLKKYNCDRYISIISEYFDVHFTYPSTNKQNFHYHGVLNPIKYYELLDSAKLFVGIGFPYEGPAPLEAINRGCVYLNPSIDPPINSDNSDFWRGKPTKRFIKSQNPYAENYIEEPHVYTLSMDDEKRLRNILENIKSNNHFPTHLPYEFSYQGMLERVQYFVNHQDLCVRRHANRRKLIVINGAEGEDCQFVCSMKKLICEPDFFNLLSINSTRIGCNDTSSEEKLILPAKIYKNNIYLSCQQDDPMYYSCSSKIQGSQRICPCRKYTKGNIAVY